MRLKDLRKAKKLRQCDVAEVINTSQAVYSRYENGERTPPMDVLKTLADFYEVSVDYLVGHADDNGIYTNNGSMRTSLLNQKIDLSKEFEKHGPRKLHKYVVKGSYGSGKSNLIHGHLHALLRNQFGDNPDPFRTVLVSKLADLSDDNITKLSQYADLLKVQQDMEEAAKK